MTRTELITQLRAEAEFLHKQNDFMSDTIATRFTQAAEMLELDEKEIQRLKVAAAEVEG